MSLPTWMHPTLNEIGRCTERSLPASASIAFDELVSYLEHDRFQRGSAAIPLLRAAAHAAYPLGDWTRAREHYDAALSLLRAEWPDAGI